MEALSFTIDGISLPAVALSGRERVSELFSFEVVCEGAGAGAPRDLVGKKAVIGLHDGFGAEREIHGLVVEARRAAFEDGSATLRVVVRPSTFPLSLGRSSRAYHDTTVVDVAKEVLGRHGLAPRLDVASPGERRPYRVQYREDDHAFVSRLLADEGIYFFFDHEDGSEMVLADRSSGAPDLVGGAQLDFIPASELRAPRESVSELRGEATMAPTRFSVGSFNPEKPQLKLSAQVGGGALEIYDAPGGGPADPAGCARRASVLAEAAAAGASWVTGRSSSVRLAPGRIVEVVGHPVARYCGRWFVVEVEVTVVQRRREGAAEQPFSCSFLAIPERVPYRPPAPRARARQAGLQSGVVGGAAGQEVFPDGAGRVRVQQHWDREGARDERSGHWMRVAQRNTAGSMLLPRVGWNVMTYNEEGSVDAPSLIARVFDVEHPPPYALPGSKTRAVWKTATVPGGGSFNELRFEDKKGAEEMFLNASRDMSEHVQRQKTEQIGNDARRKVGESYDLAVGERLTERVTQDQSISIGRREKLTVKESRMVSIGATQRETIGVSRSLHGGQAYSNTVAGSRKLQVGVALIDATLGPVTASAGKTLTIMVGGARLSVGVKSISASSSLASAQLIGGARLDLAKKGLGVAVDGRHLETAGGLMMLQTAAKLTQKGSAKITYAVGGPTVVRGQTLTVKAEKEIVVTCGATSMTIDASSVTIKTPKLHTEGSTLTIDPGAKVNVNP